VKRRHDFGGEEPHGGFNIHLREATESEVADKKMQPALAHLPGELVARRGGRTRNRVPRCEALIKVGRQLRIHRLRTMLVPELHEVPVEDRPSGTAEFQCFLIRIGDEDIAVHTDQRLFRTFGKPLRVRRSPLRAVAVAHLAHPRRRAVRMLAVTSRDRAKIAQDVPTLTEAGFTGLETDFWFGLLAPARTSPPIVRPLNKEVTLMPREPSVVRLMREQALVSAAGTLEDFGRHLAGEHDQWTKVIREANITAD